MARVNTATTKKKPEIRLTVKTDKFSFVEETDYLCYKRLCKRVRKEYGADEVYLHNNNIVVHKVTVIGTWKSERIDGVKI